MYCAHSVPVYVHVLYMCSSCLLFRHCLLLFIRVVYVEKLWMNMFLCVFLWHNFDAIYYSQYNFFSDERIIKISKTNKIYLFKKFKSIVVFYLILNLLWINARKNTFDKNNIIPAKLFPASFQLTKVNWLKRGGRAQKIHDGVK